MNAWAPALLAALWVFATGCVTNDPFAAPPESGNVKTMRQADHRCREWVKGQLAAKPAFKSATYYYGKLPRESAKTYVVFDPKDGGKPYTALCDADTGEAQAMQELGKDQASYFRTEFSKRERARLIPHRADLKPNDMANSIVAVLRVDPNGHVHAREYWLPKHVEQDFNKLFYDAVTDK